jgi:hypothetical protein
MQMLVATPIPPNTTLNCSCDTNVTTSGGSFALQGIFLSCPYTEISGGSLALQGIFLSSPYTEISGDSLALQGIFLSSPYTDQWRLVKVTVAIYETSHVSSDCFGVRNMFIRVTRVM